MSGNEDFPGCLLGQTFLVSVGLGIASGSWIVFGIAYVGLLSSLFVRKLAIIAILMCVAFTLGWGYIGYVIGMNVFESLEAGIVLGILGFMIGLIGNSGDLLSIRNMFGNNQIDNNVDHNSGEFFSDDHNYVENSENNIYQFCHKCGNKVTEGMFCNKCGTKLMR